MSTHRTTALSLCPLAALAVLALAGKSTLAHDLGTTQTLITLGAERFEIVLECDLDALALGAAPTADDAELLAVLGAMDDARLGETVANLGQLFARRVRLFAGDARIDFEVEFPDRINGRTLGMVPPTFLGLTARLRGRLPTGIEPLRFRLSRAFPSAQLTVVTAHGDVLLEEMVPRGEDSSDFGRRVASAAAPEADRGPLAGHYVLIAAGLATGLAVLMLYRWRGAITKRIGRSPD